MFYILWVIWDKTISGGIFWKIPNLHLNNQHNVIHKFLKSISFDSISISWFTFHVCRTGVQEMWLESLFNYCFFKHSVIKQLQSMNIGVNISSWQFLRTKNWKEAAVNPFVSFDNVHLVAVMNLPLFSIGRNRFTLFELRTS